MIEGITKKEYEDIIKFGYEFLNRPAEPNDELLHGILVITHNPSHKHDSGFCYIRTFGILEGGKLVDMGWHDVVDIRVPSRVDSIAKNVTRIFFDRTTNVESFSISSLSLGEDYVWV